MDISSIEESLFKPIEKNIIKSFKNNIDKKDKKLKRKRKRTKTVRTVLYISDSSDDEL